MVAAGTAMSKNCNCSIRDSSRKGEKEAVLLPCLRTATAIGIGVVEGKRKQPQFQPKNCNCNSDTSSGGEKGAGNKAKSKELQLLLGQEQLKGEKEAATVPAKELQLLQQGHEQQRGEGSSRQALFKNCKLQQGQEQ